VNVETPAGASSGNDRPGLMKAGRERGKNMAQSEQVKRVMARYNVTTKPDLLRAVRDELNEECFDPNDTDMKWNETTQSFDEVPAKPFTLRDAELRLDGMFEAEYQRLASEPHDAPEDMDVELIEDAGVAAPLTQVHLGDPLPWENETPSVEELIAETDAILREAGREDLTITPKPEREDTVNAPDLNDVAFISTEEGQAALKAAAEADALARRETKKAEQKAKAEAAARRKAEIAASEAPGPVVIVHAPDNGKPTRAARRAGIQPVEDAKPKAVKVPNAAKRVPSTVAGLRLSETETIETKHGLMRVIIGRDGKPVRASYNNDNWAWSCSSCKRRATNASCDGSAAGQPHDPVTAPFGYRREDRLVEGSDAK
jgi:hypothetical protein